MSTLSILTRAILGLPEKISPDVTARAVA